MDVLLLAYSLLCITAISGMWLFFGYTFREQSSGAPVYPLWLVRGHIVLVAITFVAMTWALVLSLSGAKTGFGDFTDHFFFVGSYVWYVATFAYGLVYHVRYDLSNAARRVRFLVSHWGLAALTFIFLTSTFALYQVPLYDMSHVKASSAQFLIQHARSTMRQEFVKTHQVHTVGSNGGRE